VLEVIENLKEAVTTLAIEQVEVPFFCRISKSRKIKYALVFGNEVHGVSQKLLHCVTDASRSHS
jgi:tRNA G18 (ribose-2'-O)-methylase SpoU